MDLKRGRRFDTDISRRMAWESRDGSMRVCMHEPRLAGDVSPFFSAEILKRTGTGPGWSVLSRHRTKASAGAALMD